MPARSTIAAALTLAALAFAPAANGIVEPGGCAKSHTAGCPPAPKISLDSTQVARKAILVTVRVDTPARVQAYGQVRWRVRQPGGGEAHLSQGLSGGAPRLLQPQAPTLFRVPLGEAVSRRLNRISPQRALLARMTVAATGLGGEETLLPFTVRLAGREG